MINTHILFSQENVLVTAAIPQPQLSETPLEYNVSSVDSLLASCSLEDSPQCSDESLATLAEVTAAETSMKVLLIIPYVHCDISLL